MKRAPLAFLTLIAIVLGLGLSSTYAQQSQPGEEDAATLRARLESAFGNNADLVKDEFRTRAPAQGGTHYWLAHAKPKLAGHFVLEYSFKPQNKHYSHVEHQIIFSVGPKGCRRGPSSPRMYSRFCLGDTVIIPVVVESPAEHEFKLTTTGLRDDEDWKTVDEKHPDVRDEGLDKTPVANPSAHLRYVGRRKPQVLVMALGNALELNAVFEAVKPGKFNLAFNQAPGGVTPPAVPIVVVDFDQPITLIAGHDTVRGFTAGSDGREWVSSTSSNSYMTSLIVMQPGDRIWLTYLRIGRFSEFQRDTNRIPGASDPAEAIRPVISVQPFSLETRDFFTSWIADYWR